MATRSFSTNSYSFSKMNIDEHEWVEQMRKSIIDDEELGKVPVCIFTVPKVLQATDPESYIPQQVALGPFHHWRPEVYDMQRYKLTAARRTQKHMNVSFERMVKIMKKDDEARIRACYHKFLDMSGDALVWMMAVDMAFLLEFIQVYAIDQDEAKLGLTLNKMKSEMSHVVDVTGKKLSHMAILRDVVMVENQIPLFLLRKMIAHQSKTTSFDLHTGDQMLKKMLMGLYHELTPFNENELPDVNLSDCDHVLDFLYHMTVPNNKELGITQVEIDFENEVIITEAKDGGENDEESSFAKQTEVRKVMNYIYKMILKSNAGLMKMFKKVVFSKPMVLLMKLPWKIISNLPILKLMKEPMQRMFVRFKGEEDDTVPKDNSSTDPPKAPTIEEITIPSVTELVKAGIGFSPVNGGIFDIRFDVSTSTLYLPVIDLDVNTEVFLRNLVAYEACVAAGPLVVARYTELMNGIIDSEEDAKYLREKGVVLNHLKSDKEVADLWNGMSKCVKLTRVPKMDLVIEDVNKRYGETWRVKFGRFMNTYVFGSWKFLTVLAALFMLLLTGLQSFCSVYSCARVFHQLPDIQGESS